MERTSRPLSPIFWAILGLGVAVAIQWAQAFSLGGWSGLLAVGETSPLRPIIEQELTDLVVVDDPGHDGQVTYVIALDPWATWAVDLVPEASYRYRRILMPLIASAFGILDGEPLFWSLMLVNLVAFTASAVAAASITRIRSLPRWAPLAVALNVGLWLSLQITSPDVIAFAAAMAGISAFLSRRDLLAVLLLSLGALGKETFVLVPLAIATYLWMNQRETRRAFVYLGSFIPLGLWSAFLVPRVPNPLETGGNLTWPFFGIVDAIPSWVNNSGREIVLLLLAAAAIGIAVWLVLRRPRSVWTWLVAPWLLLATVSSHWIWDFGNNTARAVLPLFSFAVLGLMDLACAGAPAAREASNEMPELDSTV